ncbi:hypothetical protein [Thalassomonas sp. M1454]|uniref:hypothetical protein n=1 Tax=Thalassomonas sp. M1454 TaxID=2594477 RepID=UPI00117C56B0|nr:hypothetical protein [Thalassomonas sp. M1454]TRX53944.1 hypothetical protein FNN08_13405 [Thalassomonas sp. M1454]
MKLQKIIFLSSALAALAGCNEDSEGSATTEVFDQLLASVEYDDANLKACVETTIAEQGITNTNQLTSLACSTPIESVTGLAYFKELETIDLSGAGLSCATLDGFDNQLIADAAMLGDATAIKTIQQEGCFYNYLEFADQSFRQCVVEQFAENGWASTDEVTNLKCDDINILSMEGVEIFTNLADLDIEATAVNCVAASAFAQEFEAVSVSSPAVCIIDNIDMSDDVAACLATGAAGKEFVVDLTSLTCDSPEFTDTKGLEKLTSLTELVLSDTNINCYDNRDFENSLLDTVNYSKPTSCIMTEETPFEDVLRASGNPEDPLFADPILQACFQEKVLDMGLTTLGEVTNQLVCTAKEFKFINTFQGIEEFIYITKFHANGPTIPSVDDLNYLVDLENLVDVNFQFANPLKDSGKEVVEFISQNLTQLTHLNINGFKGADYSLLKELPNLQELKAMGNLLSDADIQAIAALPQLKTVFIGNNTKFTSLLPFINQEAITIETVNISHKNYPANLCSDIAQLEASGIEVVKFNTLTCP